MTAWVRSGSTPAPPGGPENCQVAVYLAYAAPGGSAFLDRALYLPRSVDRRTRAGAVRPGSPAVLAFATKPALAPADDRPYP